MMLQHFAKAARRQPAGSTGRRAFLKAGAAVGAGLVIGFHLSDRGIAALAQTPPPAAPIPPNAFVRLAADNTVTVIAKHLEMGQGIYTGLATILAEELDADWSQIRVESAPADASRYNNLAFGPMQGTGGSSGVANSYMQLREAGAKMRAMLVAAAQQLWDVPVAEISVEKGSVWHKSTARSFKFGELAEKAAGLPVPDKVTLKDPSEFKLIGKVAPRVDARAKSNGTAQFALDVKLDGMLTALVMRPPLFGGKVRSFDAAAAKKIAGVVDVVQIPSGVAVVAKDFWTAKKGRDALVVQWDDSAAEKRGSDQIMAEYKALARQPGAAVARSDGDAGKALAGAAKTLTAEFEFPYLAHAPMEPLDCVVRLSADKCEIWAGDQFQTIDQMNAAQAAGMKPEQVTINTLFAGGSFGRRANMASDFIVEGVNIAKAIGGRAPVKLVWTREDDIKGGRYRPMYFHTFAAGLDAQGNPVAWRHRIVGQSIMGGTAFEAMVKNGVDPTSVEGASTLPYAIPNILVDLHTTKGGVPVLWWRSVGSTHTAYATEVFIDELAAAAGKDPYQYRRALLSGHPRHLAVLDLAAKQAGWETPLPAGRFRGIAVAESFGSFVAQVVEISTAGGQFKVERVVCAVDCGVAVNPSVIRAQMEGGIGYGLGAALYDAITLDKGEVQQSNFHDYRSLRIDEMPKVEVHIVASKETPTGVGEPGVPPVAPALANAVFAATGKRVRALPFTSSFQI